MLSGGLGMSFSKTGLAVCFLFIAGTGLSAGAQLSTQSSASTSSESLPSSPENSVKKDRSYSGDVGFTLYGKRLQDEIVNSRIARLIIELNLSTTYRDWLSGELTAVQFLTSGQASNLYAVTEGSPSSATLVDKAFVQARYFPNGWGGYVRTGIIPAGLAQFYSSMYEQSNAGYSVVAGFDNKSPNTTKENEVQALVAVTQSIPTSKSNSNRIIDEDTLPMLSTATVYASVPFNIGATRLKGSHTRFVFTDPSSQSAMDSSTLGSTTTGNGKGGYLFANDYRGAESALILEQDLFLADKITLKGSVLNNDAAPSGANSGWQTKIEYKKGFNKFNLIPNVSRFRIEADALPASYGQPGIYTNRYGRGLGLKLEVPSEKFNISAGYVEANVLNTNTTSSVYQSDRQSYTLSMEAKYDIF
jgi:hypothetical protein